MGYCAAKKETYYGFRLLAVTTLDGIIVDWNLFAANADERVGPQECWKVTAASAFWATRAFRRQQGQNPRVWDTAMNRAWRVIETTFAQAKGAFGLEKPGARSLWGLQSRLIAKPVDCKDHGSDACSMPQCAAGTFAVAADGVQFLARFWSAFERKLTENGIFRFHIKRDYEDQDQVQPFCAEAKTLRRGFASRLRSVADASAEQPQNACVASVNNSRPL